MHEIQGSPWDGKSRVLIRTRRVGYALSSALIWYLSWDSDTVVWNWRLAKGKLLREMDGTADGL